MMISQRGPITITEYGRQENGVCHFELRYVTGHFSHISFSLFIMPLEQTEENLMALAMERFGL